MRIASTSSERLYPREEKKKKERKGFDQRRILAIAVSLFRILAAHANKQKGRKNEERLNVSLKEREREREK